MCKQNSEHDLLPWQWFRIVIKNIAAYNGLNLDTDLGMVDHGRCPGLEGGKDPYFG